MQGEAHITPELFRFFEELKQNNNREWFQANRERYELHVREPLLRFITDFGMYLYEISPHFLADPAPMGGSLFRIHRDIRFSRDKSPYKTAAGIQFRHKAGKDAHAPGFYLHLEPGNVFAAVGLWKPDARTLGMIRDAILAAPSRWQRVLSQEPFASTFVQAGDRLKRPPKGYDPNHPLVDELKRKDFLATTDFTEKEACAPDFVVHYAEACRMAAAYMEFLTRAAGLPW